MCYSVGYHLERFESVLTQLFAPEHSQDTDLAPLDQKRIARKGYHSFFLCPLGVAYTLVVLYIVCQVGLAFLCDPANLQIADSDPLVFTVQAGV